MNKVIAVALALFGVWCLVAVLQPQWNPFSGILLGALMAASFGGAIKFWTKKVDSDANRT